MEYRVEELARRSGVAVDTIRFYQGKGLLPQPRRQGRVTFYGQPHIERLERIKRLQERGFSLAVIRRFLDGELEASDESLVEAITRPGQAGTLTMEELAARSGVAPPLLQTLVQAGLLEPTTDSSGEARYSNDDLDALEAGMKLIAAGIPLADLLDLGRQHAANTEATARRAVELFDKHVRERMQAGDGAGTEAQLVVLFDELLEASGRLVRRHFERTLVRAARAHIERTT